MAYCKCGAEIDYVKSPSGKDIAVETGWYRTVDPIEPVTLVTEDGRVIRTKEKGVVGFEPHWNYCPFASEFRQRNTQAAKPRPSNPSRPPETQKIKQTSFEFTTQKGLNNG